MKLVVESSTRDVDTVPVAIGIGEQQTLKRYLAEYERLMACRPLQAEIPCEISISSSETGGLRIKTKLPNDDDRSILLHRLRPFMLKSEPASFARVSRILGRRISHPVVRELLSLQHRLWRGQAFAAQGVIKVNGRQLNGERLTRAWLDGTEYHRDPEKAASFGSVQRLHFSPLFDWILVNLLTDKLRAISNLAALAALVLGETPELQFSDHRLLRSDS